MNTETSPATPQGTTTLINIGDMPNTAEEIFTYVRDALVLKATPLKLISISLHSKATLLPGDWQLWSAPEAEMASGLYDEISKHEKAVRAKGTELDTIRDKAEKLKKGILRALDDIMGDLPTDKETLMTNIRKWRNREEEKAAAEAKRIDDLRKKEEEEKQIAEALRLEKEAEALKAAGHTELAEEVKKEAEEVIKEDIFIPPTITQAAIPKGGPVKRKYWKFQVIDFASLQDDYKLQNDTKIRRQIENHGQAHGIKGIKAWQE